MKMKKIYINLVPIHSGGGLQNSINFILNIDIKQLQSKEIIFIIRNNDNLLKICEDKGYNVVVVENTFLARLKFELFFFKRKKDVLIFTLFGTVPFLSWSNFTITGCAYSNLFYPEIDFWKHLNFMNKQIKLLKDYYRYKNLRLSNIVIFETEVLANRAKSLYNFDKSSVYTVKMAVNSLVKKSYKNNNLDTDKKLFNILYLGSAHPNKRQHLLVDIVSEILKNKVYNIRFFVTLDDNSYAVEVLNEIKKRNLEKYIINIGRVENEKVADIIDDSDAMINIAALESFSNNFVEAWQMEKVLFVTDADWARASCNDGAVYLDINNLKNLSNNIIEISKDNNLYAEYVKKGTLELNQYPNAKEKIRNYIKIINSYSKKGLR